MPNTFTGAPVLRPLVSAIRPALVVTPIGLNVNRDGHDCGDHRSEYRPAGI